MSPAHGPSHAHGQTREGNVEGSCTPFEADCSHADWGWETEVFIIQGESRQDLIGAVERLLQMLSSRPALELKDLAYTLNCLLQEATHRLAVIAGSVQELVEKLNYALQRLADPRCARIKDRSGVFFFEEPLSREGALAFLFPGEGSQYVNMLADLRRYFPEVRASFELADRFFLGDERTLSPSQLLFPATCVPSASGSVSDQHLWEMDDVAMASVFAADHAVFTLLDRLQIRPHAVVGHSSGEFTALLASGAIEIHDEEELTQFGRALIHLYGSMGEHLPEARFMAVGAANPEIVAAAVAESHGELYVTMDNCPHQVIVCGTDVAIARALDRMQKQGAICSLLPFNRPYHTPLFQSVRDHLFPVFQQRKFVSPHTMIYSCATARPLPRDPADIRQLAVDQWARPVRFRETIEAMYDAAVRVFVEVGPRGNLTGFVDDILRNRRYLAVPSNVTHRSGITQLNHLIGLLAAHGVPMRLDHLYARRAPQRLSFTASVARTTTTGKHTVEDPTCATAVVPAPASNGSPPPPRGQGASRFEMMQQYLQTMEQFLGIQQEVMTAYITRRGREPSVVALEGGTAGAAPSDSSPCQPLPASAGPFDIVVSSLIPGQALIATCRLDLQDDVFLRHHTIGRAPSALDERLTALPVVPLSISVEIMAQVAALLVPDQQLVTVKDVRTHRWIAVEEAHRVLLVTAKCHSSPMTSEEVEVRILEASVGNGMGFNKEHLLVEATMVFGHDYPSPDSPGAFPLHSERPYSFHPEQYYRDVMFHGPLFQSVVAIDRSGDDGVEATVSLQPRAELRQGRGHPQLLTEPVLLDAVGQLASFWAWDRFESGFVAFPIGFEALYLYGPCLRSSEPIKCRARITSLAGGQIRSDIEVVDRTGRLLMRLVGYQNRRIFDWTRAFVRFLLFPRDAMLCTVWPSPIAHLPASLGFRCCRVDEAGDGIWVKAIACIVLNRRERETWRRLSGSERQRRNWLLGRLAAKDAVRLYLKDRYQLEACAADIDIDTDEHDQPVVGGELIERLGRRLSLSLACTGAKAVAVVGECGSHGGLGIEARPVGGHHQAIEETALSTHERGLLDGIPSAARGEWLLRFWCAKAALAKAIGRGMGGSSRHIVVRERDVEAGNVGLTAADDLGGRVPTHTGALFVANTGCEENLIFACALVL